MLKGIDINQRIEFVSKNDKTEPKTVFVLRPLSGIERLNTISNSKYSIEKTLCLAIVEIKNNKSMPVADYVKTLSLEVINELFGKINELNEMKDDDKKN